jgi:hypothetical protein
MKEPGESDSGTGARFASEKQVPRCARNDNFWKKLSKKGKGNTGVSPLRFAPVEMTRFGGGRQKTEAIPAG